MRFIRLPHVIFSSLFACFALSGHALAQGHSFEEGQKIQWKDRITGKWMEGEFVGETPGDKRPIILQRPGEPGTRTAWTWDALKAGTYRWDTGTGVIQGTWHAANDDEMGDQGGAGVVLEKAKAGENWVAFKYRASNPSEEWLGLAEVNRRSVREGAMRIPPGQERRVTPAAGN